MTSIRNARAAEPATACCASWPPPGAHRISSMEATVRTGGCLCGAVRYVVRGEPVHVGRCHCADCRKESGSAFTIYAQWPVEAFELEGTGELVVYEGRGFCPRCGSRLLNPPDPEDSLIEIRIGTLDDAPFDLRPEAEIWVKRREPWLAAVDGATQHHENRRSSRQAASRHRQPA